MSILKTIQQETTNELAADAIFSTNNIPVLSENIADIQYEIDKAVGEIGMVALVLTPTASTDSPEAINIYYDEVRILIRLIENPTIWTSTNTSVTVADLAEAVVTILHCWQPSGGGEVVYASKPTISLVPNSEFLYIYDVNFRMSLGSVYVRPQLDTPVINLGTNSFTVTTTTPGAAPFYALGPTGYPSPTSGTLYTGQVNSVPSGTLIKVRSWLAGYLTSLTASATMP